MLMPGVLGLMSGNVFSDDVGVVISSKIETAKRKIYIVFFMNDVKYYQFRSFSQSDTEIYSALEIHIG